jgi:hypothetical protein
VDPSSAKGPHVAGPAKEKVMKAEQAKKIADQALQQLVGAIRAGKSESLQQYLRMLGRFHRYSFGNVLMILSQNPKATHVAGFRTWQELGRYVNKGEKGIVILAPMTIQPKEEATREGQPARPILRFRAAYVFDVSQTDGQPLPEPSRVSGDPREHLDRLRSHILGRGISIDPGDVPLGADGVSRGGRIGIRIGLSPPEEFSVLLHEFAHELLHRGDDRPRSKTVRETEAEAVAFVVSSAIGLDTGTAASDYIQLYDGKAGTLAASLARIQHVAAEIIVALRQEEQQAEAA